jgi:hypothetical protein
MRRSGWCIGNPTSHRTSSPRIANPTSSGPRSSSYQIGAIPPPSPASS